MCVRIDTVVFSSFSKKGTSLRRCPRNWFKWTNLVLRSMDHQRKKLHCRKTH